MGHFLTAVPATGMFPPGQCCHSRGTQGSWACPSATRECSGFPWRLCPKAELSHELHTKCQKPQGGMSRSAQGTRCSSREASLPGMEPGCSPREQPALPVFHQLLTQAPSCCPSGALSIPKAFQASWDRPSSGTFPADSPGARAAFPSDSSHCAPPLPPPQNPSGSSLWVHPLQTQSCLWERD